MKCPGQPTLAAGVPRTSSVHADRGTAAHKVFEWCLQHRRHASYYVGQAVPVPDSKIGSVMFGQDDADAVQLAVEWVREQIQPGDEVALEERLHYSEDYWGTTDVSLYRPGTAELTVVDYKHGSGLAVEATDNPQGISYGLMKAKMLGNRGIASVRFVIIQPRCSHEDGPVREFVIDGVDMLDWEDRIVAAIEATRAAARRHGLEGGDPDAWAGEYLASGKHCRWCPAAGFCPRLKTDALAAAADAFEPVEVAPGGPYDPAKLAETLGKLDRVEAWVKAVREFAYGEAERGVRIPGYKLVPKRPTRRWKSEPEAAGALTLFGVEEADLYERSFRSPAQVEALLEPTMDGKTKKARLAAAKALLADYVEAVSSGHNLAPADDPRPPIRSDAADDFTPAA